jgi:cobalt-zinc-cadmium efflux system protein
MGNHSVHRKNPSRRLLISILLNGFITLVEVVGGIFSNSLALISDAIHNLSDTLALALAWLANSVSGRKPDVKRTYGYKRFEILSAFINVSLLTAISLYLIYEAILRFFHPEPVKSGLMILIAVIGLFVNLFSVLFLHRDSKKSLNVKAAYVHLLGDTLSSLAVIGGAILIYYMQIVWIDPLLTLVISIVIIVQAFKILHESVDILMQSTPRNLDLGEIKTHLEKHPLIQNIHHVHCWQLQDHDILFEAHIETSQDLLLSDSGKLVTEIEEALREKFHITHTTLQVEFDVCTDKAMIKQPKGEN